LNRRVILLLAFVIAVTGALLGLKGLAGHQVRQAVPVSSPVSAPNDSPSASAPVSQPIFAPDFSLKSLPDGRQVQLSALRGKAVLINFWATYCGPCKEEMPFLVDLQKRYGPEGLQILGVTMDDADEKAIIEFTRKMGVNYPILQGTDKMADSYGGINGLPTTFFVGRSGKVVKELLGSAEKPVFEDLVKQSLQQSAGGAEHSREKQNP